MAPAADDPAPNGNGAATKAYPMLEVARHASRRSAWLAMDGKVYDVTPYLDEHPGGDDILLDSSGRDATREFEDVGHSQSAREHLASLCIGEVREPTEEELAAAPLLDKAPPVADGGGAASAVLKVALPILLAVLAYFLRQWSK